VKEQLQVLPLRNMIDQGTTRITQEREQSDVAHLGTVSVKARSHIRGVIYRHREWLEGHRRQAEKQQRNPNR
jgi:hypothetical protein